MGLILELEESDFAGFIADGTIYTAKVVNVGLRERKARNEGEDPTKRIEFKFKLISDDSHDGQDIWGSTSTKFVDHPKCKLKGWSEAILGRNLPVRYKLDTDDLLDRECRVVVSYRTWQQGDETRERNEISDVIPTREAAMAMAAENDSPF